MPAEVDDREGEDDWRWLVAAFAIARRKREFQYNVLAEAEDVVARYAEKVPVGAGTLQQALLRGAASVATGVAAIMAIRAVARGGSGGYHFPTVWNPQQAFRRP